MTMYEYNCKITKVVDGDTIDCDIDLGFGVILQNERVRLVGIDTPESRTSDPVEKVFGNAAKHRVHTFLDGKDVVIRTKAFKGKFGRILGDFFVNDVSLTDTLLREHHAVVYDGSSKELIHEAHLKNRAILEAFWRT